MLIRFHSDGLNLVIGDLGLCFNFEEIESSDCGTPSYQSPFTFCRGQRACAKDDMWALGAILFELVFGFPLFRDVRLARHCVCFSG